MTNFMDSGKILDDFMYIVYVRCPNCGKCATIMDYVSNKTEGLTISSSSKRGSEQSVKKTARSRNPPDFRKLSCLYCAFTKVWRRGMPALNLYEALWLQTPCCGEILWTLNKDHLDFIAQYVEAKLRIKFSGTEFYRNQTLISRLPLWIKSAKNRDEVLKGTRRLYKLAENI